MNSIQKVRRALGINQEALAQLLGISVSLLKMAETHKRSLPFHADLMLDWMLKRVEALPEFPMKAPETDAGELEEELVRLRRRKIRLEKLLAAEAEKRKQMQGLVLFCDDFALQYPSSEYPSAGMRINALRYNA